MAVKKNKNVADVKIVDAEKAIPVVIETNEKESQIVNKSDGKTLAPKTTEQDDLVTAGQRRVNLIWETTQAVIAIAISLAVIYCQIKKIDSQILNNAFFLIVSMYYVRTNHKIIGGVANPKYEGR